MQNLAPAARQGTRLALITAASIWSGIGSAGTIVSVSKDGRDVVMQLSAEEMKTLKSGDTVTVAMPAAGATLEGTIVRIKNKRASLRLEKSGKGLKAGLKTQMAAAAPVPVAAPVTTTAVQETASATDPVAGFRNDTFHPFTVNPGQLYTHSTRRTDVMTALVSGEDSMSSSDVDADIKTQGPQVALSYILGTGQTVKGGLIVRHSSSEGEMSLDFGGQSNDESLATQRTTITPIVAARLAPGLTAGAQLQIVQARYSGEFYEKSRNLSWARPIVGAVAYSSKLEAGVTFAAKVYESDTVVSEDGTQSSTIRVAEPAVLQTHGKYRMSSDQAAFASLAYNQNRMLNVDGQTKWKNNADLRAGLEQKMDMETTFTAGISGTTPAHRTRDEMAPDTVTRYGFLLGFDKEPSPGKRFGGLVQYETGRDDYEDDDLGNVEMEHRVFALSVTGMVAL